MLWHKNLSTTKHYAKMLDKKASEDMKILRDEFKKGLQINQNQFKSQLNIDS